LTPLASPARLSATAARAVAVRGATVSASPAPNTDTGGSTSTRYDVSGPMRASPATPTAARIGPAVIGIRGPIRALSAPARAEKTSMISVTGISETPAASGVNPATTCRVRTSQKKIPPSAAYTAKVTALVALNTREAKMLSGNIGSLVRVSQARKPAIATRPAASDPQTPGEPIPLVGQAISP